MMPQIAAHEKTELGVRMCCPAAAAGTGTWNGNENDAIRVFKVTGKRNAARTPNKRPICDYSFIGNSEFFMT
jgi:hypothetical protein